MKYRPDLSNSAARSSRRQFGFSLIELMVGLTISLLGTLIIFDVFSVNEQYKRRTVAGNDALQNGAFASYRLDQLVKMSGAGLGVGDKVQSILGCPINAWRSGTPIIPSSYPTPFNSIISMPVVATPALIIDGGSGGTDALITMGAQSSARVAMIQLDSAPSTLNISVVSPIGIRRNDFLLAVEQDTTQLFASGVRKPCRLAQVSNSTIVSGDFVQDPFTLAGTYTKSDGFGTTYSDSTRLVDLGVSPRFSAFAIGTDPVNSQANSLLELDLLQRDSAAPIKSLAENVINLQAIYGVAANATDTHVSSWQAAVSPNWDAASLTNGSANAAANLKLIRAVRLAVVTRSAKKETEVVSPTSLTLFSDTSLPVSMTFSGSQLKYRYKIFDVTIPVRNNGT